MGTGTSGGGSTSQGGTISGGSQRYGGQGAGRGVWGGRGSGQSVPLFSLLFSGDTTNFKYTARRGLQKSPGNKNNNTCFVFFVIVPHFSNSCCRDSESRQDKKYLSCVFLAALPHFENLCSGPLGKPPPPPPRTLPQTPSPRTLPQPPPPRTLPPHTLPQPPPLAAPRCSCCGLQPHQTLHPAPYTLTPTPPGSHAAAGPWTPTSPGTVTTTQSRSRVPRVSKRIRWLRSPQKPQSRGLRNQLPSSPPPPCPTTLA